MMVEKILETATLDSDELPLNREEIDLDALLRTLVGKYQNLHPDKKMTYQSWKETLKFKADAFHLENAMNNLLDNAVKYGGDEIDVLLGSQGDQLKISVQDNGHQLEKEQAKRLFDKFYRVPKGNTHNVKGFGIGLFYTKKIIEKHGGTITIDCRKYTKFIITLPYA